MKNKLFTFAAITIIAFSGLQAVTYQQAQVNAQRWLSQVFAPTVIPFETAYMAAMVAEFGAVNGRYLQIKPTDPVVEDKTGIVELAVDIYQAPGGHGWTVTVHIEGPDETTALIRYAFQTWDGSPAFPEQRATGAWIETDELGEALP